MKAPETTAVLVAAGQAAQRALSTYTVLGVRAWAKELAGKDADSSIRALDRFCQVHRLNVGSLEPLRDFYTNLWLSGTFVPLAKYVTAYPLAQLQGDYEGISAVLPPRPDWLGDSNPLRALFGPVPRLVQCLRTRLHETTSAGVPTVRALRLAWSLLGSKGMFPALWVDQVGQSLRDHAQLLSAEPTPLPTLARRVLQVVARSIAVAARPTPKAVAPYKYDSLPRPKLSASSGWTKVYDQESNRWRTLSGTRAAQYHQLGGQAAEELTGMEFRPTTGLVEFRQVPYQFLWSDWDYEPRVSIVALQEPFKIRTISIPDGPAMAAASPFQKLWHRTMRQLGPFQLIGGVPVADALAQIPGGGDTPFVSGDYSAATDRLSMEATRLVVEELFKPFALPAELRRRCIESLCAADLDYSTTLGTFRGRVPDALLDSIKLPPVTKQSNGQLMGNILSFPILCIVNLATYVTARVALGDLPDWEQIEETGYMTVDQINNLEVLVNGDDILFRARPHLYRTWLKTAQAFGFKPSPGKNYYSQRFFTINSELYVPVPAPDQARRGDYERVIRPWWAAYLTDMVQARRWALKHVGEDVLSSDIRRVLPPMQEALRASVTPEVWPTANRLWIWSLQDEGILEPYTGLNWFYPVPLGGLGLDPAGFSEQVTSTYAQRKLACKLALDPERGQRFFPGMEKHLLTESEVQKARSLFAGAAVHMKGDLVIDTHGNRYVRDRDLLEVVEDGVVTIPVHPTVDTQVLSSGLVDPWLDFHVEDARLDPVKVRQGVSRALKWGCALSDNKVVPLEELDGRPRYLASRKIIFLEDKQVKRMYQQ